MVVSFKHIVHMIRLIHLEPIFFILNMTTTCISSTQPIEIIMVFTKYGACSVSPTVTCFCSIEALNIHLICSTIYLSIKFIKSKYECLSKKMNRVHNYQIRYKNKSVPGIISAVVRECAQYMMKKNVKTNATKVFTVIFIL